MPDIFIKGTVDIEVNDIDLGKVLLPFFCHAAGLVAESDFIVSLGSYNWTHCSTALHCFVGWISLFLSGESEI